MRHWLFIVFVVAALALTAGCQNVQPPGPTVIPTDVTELPELRTVTPSPSLTLAPQATATLPPTESGPLATLRPVVTAPMLATTTVAVAQQPAPAATTPPRCIQAKQGNTLYWLAIQGGYADLNGSLAAIRALNNMCDSCNDIEIGRTYCLPPFTPTPLPEGYEATLAKMQTELPSLSSTRSFALVDYVGSPGTELEFAL